MARGLTRGDIWLHRFSEPDKRRPVVILSRADAIEVMQTVLVAGITSTIRDLPTEVALGPGHGMKGPCVINLDHVFTVRQSELRRYVTTLDVETMRNICRALAIATGCAA